MKTGSVSKKTVFIVVVLLVICVVTVMLVFCTPHMPDAVLGMDLNAVQAADITYAPIGDNLASQTLLSAPDAQELSKIISETKFIFKSPFKKSIWGCPLYKVILYTQDDWSSFSIGEDGIISLEKGTYKAGSDALVKALERFTAQ